MERIQRPWSYGKRKHLKNPTIVTRKKPQQNKGEDGCVKVVEDKETKSNEEQKKTVPQSPNHIAIIEDDSDESPHNVNPLTNEDIGKIA